MHSDSPSPVGRRLAYDGLLPGLTLPELRSYYDAQPTDSLNGVLAHLVAALRNVHEHAHELEEFIAAAKQSAKAAANGG